MELRISKLLLIFFLFFIFLDLSLLGIYFYKKGKTKESAKAPAISISTSLLPPKGKLVNEAAMGISRHEVEGRMVYEITGWIKEIDEQARKIVLEQPGTPWQEEVFIEEGAVIKEVFLNEEEAFEYNPKTFADLVPDKTRVKALCTDPSCKKVSSVSIIETIVF